MAQNQDRRTAETLTDWRQLAGAVEANLEALRHLDGHRIRLTELARQAQDLITQQAALTASKQEISRQLQRVMDEGRTAATFVRTGVREQFGRRSEKMVEFGLQPFRGIRRKAKPTTPETPPSPESPSQTTPTTPPEPGS